MPELEAHINQLNNECKSFEEQINTRDRMLEEKDRKMEELREKIVQYQQSEEANSEIVYHNKSLMAEIDKFH